MINKSKSLPKLLRKYSLKILYIFVLLLIIISGNQTSNITTSNTNRVKSILSSRIVETNNVKLVTNVKDIAKYGSNYRLEFTGTLTGYGPDCVGCIGVLYCAPNPNVTNGNISYNDQEYGNIRILAADYSIPCGSIIKISNFKYVNGDFYGIVLDRGSSIVGLTMDLLYASENDTIKIGRARNIKFTVERWGW